MPSSAFRQTAAAAHDHILTVQEALEPLYMQLEKDAEVQLVAAAVKAGWSPEDAVSAIDELRKHDVVSAKSRGN